MRQGRHALLATGMAALFLGAPSAALGLDYCVGSPPSCSGTPEPDLQSALDAAKQSTLVADRVFIGPGTYSRLDGFDYSDLNNSNTVEIIGTGSPKPKLTMTTSGSDKNVLKVAQFGSVISNLTIEIPQASNQARGLFMQNGDTAQNVTIIGAMPPSLQFGIQMGSSKVLDSSVTFAPGYGLGIFASVNGPSEISDTTIVGLRGIDVAVTTGNTLTLSRNRISALQAGILNYYGNVTLNNTLIDLQGGSGDGITMDTVDPGQQSNTIDADELTIRNGDANSNAIRQTNNDPNSTQTIDLRDSILWDVGHPIRQETPVTANSTYTVTSSNNDYDQDDNLPMAPVAGQVRMETSISEVNPGFLNPILGANGFAGDYRLAFNSPVIDTGSSAALGSSETDLRGLSRIVDGAPPFSGAVRDLGAYEYQHTAPAVTASAAPPSAPVGGAIGFTAAGIDVDGEALSYSWAFNDGGTGTGATVSHAFSTPGAHTGTVTVTDPSGLTATAVATVTANASVAAKKCKKKKRKRPAAAAKKKKCKKKKKR